MNLTQAIERIAIIGAAVGLLGWAAPGACAQEPAPTLAPTGTVRAIFLDANPVQGTIDPATGAPSGPAVELTRALAQRVGVRFTVTPVKGTAAVMEGIKAGTADIGYLAFDPARAQEVGFSQTWSLAHNAYLVPAGSAIQSAPEIDRPGVRLGVGARDAADLFLSRTIKQASLTRNELGSIAEMIRMVSAGEVDAYAANRTRLYQAQPQLPGARILAENFLSVEQAIAVTKGDAAKLAVVNRFLDEARSTGLIAAALERAKLAGVDVAPPNTR
jgi:polar amino acid transport system substrate-binding protein